MTESQRPTSDRVEPAPDFLLATSPASAGALSHITLEVPFAMAPIASPGDRAASSALLGKY